MQFKLSKKSIGRSLTTFHITDSAGNICGSANIPNAEVDNFTKCWAGEQPAPAAAPGKQARATAAIVAALKKGPRLSRQGVLRGS